MQQTSTRDYFWIGIAYPAALAVAALVYIQLGWLDLWWRIAVADVAATCVVFGFSREFKNSSFYDAYWSVAPPIVLLALVIETNTLDLRVFLLFVLVMFWSLRLTHNWARGWAGLQHEDWRYGDLAQATGRWYPLVDFFGIQLFPTLIVLLGCYPLLLAMNPVTDWQWLDYIWGVTGLLAVLLEMRADNSLRRFRREARGGGQVMREDVWSWCRHPNYLGEIGFWVALGIAGYSASGLWQAWIGVIAMVLLFLVVSIPMLDKRQLANKPGYAEYKKQVPALLPIIGWH